MNKKVTFLLREEEIVHEVFLDYINLFLSTGEVPGVFNIDEKRIIISSLN